jgi:hypothetical protein
MEKCRSVEPMETPSSDTPTQVQENPCKPYWDYKKRQHREKKQNNAVVKAPKLQEDTTPSESSEVLTRSQGKLWKRMDISEIKFFTPTIVIDLSYEANMNEKVRIYSTMQLETLFSY